MRTGKRLLEVKVPISKERELILQFMELKCANNMNDLRLASSLKLAARLTPWFWSSEIHVRFLT